MTPSTVIEIGRVAIEVTLLVSAPLFIAALSPAWSSASSRPPPRSTR
jgi:hypothetical protein